MLVSIVVAASANGVIGRNGKLPWHIPDDLRRFRELTLGKPVVMGRRTYDSIGRPLPGRRNIVISRQSSLRLSGCDLVESTAGALELAAGADEVMIIGGERVYEELLPRTTRIHMTRVHATIEGDAFFPALESDEWRILWSEEHPATDMQPLSFTFETLERR
jgi:dihydrofolate reductase